ncbi:MAG TPA: SEC59/DGK1/VTE5 family protein [Bacteroidota bacterium]|nr:SEC59/DGK1/VTE5 family protein [Bacteroidota bacterium]
MSLPKAESSKPPDGIGIESGIDTSYRAELFRKAIHFSSIAIPIFYFFTPRSVALSALVPLTVVCLSIDIARLYSPPVEEWFTRAFGWLLRRKESDKARKRLNGATYVLISATVCVLVFPKLIAITSFIILIISDMMSALVGRRFGRHRFFEKSIEGSAAFFLSALLIILFTPKIDYLLGEYIIGVVAAAGGAIIEALPWDVDDNFTIPITVGSVLWLGYLLFYPSLDIYKFG